MRDRNVDETEESPQDELTARVLFLMFDRQLHACLLDSWIVVQEPFVFNLEKRRAAKAYSRYPLGQES
jgi:hypothetical protein